MREREFVEADEGELAAALRQLQPAPTRTSREQVWYRAGLEAGRRSTNRWRALAACMTVAAGVTVGMRPVSQRPADGPVVARNVAMTPVVVQGEGVAEPAPSAAYLRLRDAVAQNGLAGLGPVEVGGGGSAPPAPRGWPLEF